MQVLKTNSSQIEENDTKLIEDTHLPVENLIVMLIEREIRNPVIYNAEKMYIRLEFLDKKIDVVWNIPTSGISEVIYSVLPCKYIWVALKIRPLFDEENLIDPDLYQVVFTVYQDLYNNNYSIIRRFVNSIDTKQKSKVCPVKFLSMVGEECEDYLLVDLFDNTIFMKPQLSLSQETPTPTPPPPSIFPDDFVFNDTATEVVIKFPNGEYKTIPFRYLVSSLAPNGWLCNSLIDVCLELFVQEKLANKKEWSDQVIVFDSLFYQKIYRHRNSMAYANINTYADIIKEVYPKNRNIPKFQKELLVIPIIHNQHWLLALVHMPMNVIYDDNSEFAVDLNAPKQRCRILILDSKAGDEYTRPLVDRLHDTVFDCIRHWLNLMIWNIDDIPNDVSGCVKIVCNKLPIQPNNNDCGIFLLKFVEEFVCRNTSWTKLPITELQNLKVEDEVSFYKDAIDYRTFLSDTVKARAINLGEDFFDNFSEIVTGIRREEKKNRKNRKENNV